MSPRVLLMRHGEIPQYKPRRFIGQQDLPLTETGRAQAIAAGKALRGMDIGRIVCSDLSRTRETARLAAEHCGLDGIPIEPEARLREINLGQWEGLTIKEVEAAFPGEYAARGENLALARPGGGESFLDLQQRTAPFFDALFTETQGTTLMVAHAGVNRTILCHVLGLDLNNLFRIGQDYCCVNSIVRTGMGRCVDWMNLQPWRNAT